MIKLCILQYSEFFNFMIQIMVNKNEKLSLNELLINMNFVHKRQNYIQIAKCLKVDHIFDFNKVKNYQKIEVSMKQVVHDMHWNKTTNIKQNPKIKVKVKDTRINKYEQ